MMEPAVDWSPRIRDTTMAVASSTETSSFPLARDFSAFHTYFVALMVDSTIFTGNGRNSLRRLRVTTFITSLSWYSALMIRPVFTGTR